MCVHCDFHTRRASQQRRMAAAGNPATRAAHEQVASLRDGKAAEFRATHG